MRGARARLIGIVVVATALVAAPAAVAEIQHVTSSGDTILGDGTLRTVMLEANADDTIVIDPGVNPTLTLGEVLVEKDLTIVGQGVGITTISGEDNGRIFNVFPGFDAEIQDMTLTDGKAENGQATALPSDGNPGTAAERGGAIINAGDLTLRRVAVTSSVAGHGAVDVDGGTAGASGGGILSTGPLAVIDSTISGNSAGNGGGAPPGGGYDGGFGGGIAIGGAGNLLLLRSTVSDNHGGAGGLAGTASGGDGGGGGGIQASGNMATILNSTIAGNDAGSASVITVQPADGGNGGGIHSSGSDNEIISTTIAGNTAGAGAGPGGVDGEGGGIFRADETTTLSNSLLAENTSEGAGSFNCGPGLTDEDGNLQFPDDPVCPAGFATGNPLLGPLAANGGPTLTMAPAPGGAAVDKIAFADCRGPLNEQLITDQRSFVRPVPAGGLCDIGALEYAPPPPAPPVAATATPPPPATKKCAKKKKGKKKKKCKKKKKKKK